MKISPERRRKILLAVRIILLLLLSATIVWVYHAVGGGILFEILIVAASIVALDFLLDVTKIKRKLAAKFKKLRARIKKTRISAIFDAVLDPIKNRLRQRAEFKKKYLKGTSERRFERRRGSAKAPRPVLIRADARRCRDNGEKVRMLYIIKLLQMIKSGKKVKTSDTPREIERKLTPGEGKVLIDTYERLRYDRACTVDDPTLAACEESVRGH
ncbi:MAG: hypothetical protein IJT70_06170 [Clostridia bacterium]|nr:hypothetical protein [Clostridia bacterium]MBR0303169.1 hypothetical protein [Clostridia bacterium]